MTTEPQTPADEATERLMHLRGILADLDGFIQRRAEEIATPLIESAGERARGMVAEAERETERQRDLAAERLHRLEPLQRFADKNRDAVARLGAALGYRYPSGHELLSLVAEVEARLAKESKDG